jgi:hypothetical protein
MKYVITIVLTALVVGFGITAYFKGWFPSITFNKPQAVSVQNTEVADTIIETTPSPVPPASTSAEIKIDNNNVAILAAVREALIAKHGSDFSDLNYAIKKVDGVYASGMVNGSGGGGMWFAVNINGKWTIVSDGNGVILCSDLLPYPSFPKDMVPECWDASTDKIVKR